MAEGNSTSLGVDPLDVDTNLVDWVKSLTSEGLIQLIDIDILLSNSSLSKEFRDGIGGTDTHNLRGNTYHIWDDSTLNGVFNESGDNWKIEFFSNWSSGKEDSSGSISDLGGVSSSGWSILFECSLELLESFESGFLSDSIILGDGHFGDFIAILDGGLDGNDFFLEESLLLGEGSLSVWLDGESVLSLSSDTELRKYSMN